MRTRYIYSHVDGHLVAKFENGDCVFIDQTYYAPVNEAPQVMPDIQPYKSMIDGSEITSRSRHKEHLKAHGCVEVGNDSSLWRPRQPIAPPPGLKETIIRAVNEVEQRERSKKWH